VTIGLAFAFDQAASFDTVGFDNRRLLAAGNVPFGDAWARAVDITTGVHDGAPFQHTLSGRWRVHNPFASGYDGGWLGIRRRVS
jgi:hypothetical protein